METSNPLVTGVNVIAIYVTDLDAAREFYVDILGLTENHSSPPGVTLKAGEMLLYLEGKREGRESADTKYATTSIVFATESVKQTYKHLRKMNVPSMQEYVAYSDEFAMFRINDPDGNVIEFAGKP